LEKRRQKVEIVRQNGYKNLKNRDKKLKNGVQMVRNGEAETT